MGANYSNILIINNSPAHEGMPVVATLEPRSELLIRWEPDTKRIFIATAPFKKWCSDSQISFSSILDSLNKDGLHAEMIKKRMGKGLPYSIPPVMTIMIQVPDNATGSMFGLDDMDASDASAKKDTEV